MTRRLLGATFVMAALVVVGLGGRAAHAQPAGAGTLSFDLRFSPNNGDQFAVQNADQVYFYQNRASCLCAEKFPNNTRFQMGLYEQLTDVTTPLDLPMTTWVGTDTACDDNARDTTLTCREVPENQFTTVTDFNSISIGGGVGFFLAQIPTNYFIEPTDPQGGCQPETGTHTIFDLVDNGTQNVMGQTSYDYDTLPPAPPTGFNALGGEKAIQIGFDIPSEGTADILWYQVLCAKTDGTPAYSSPSDTPKWLSSHDLCGLPQEIPFVSSTLTQGGDGGVDAGGFTVVDGGIDAPFDTPDAAVDAALGADAAPPPTTLVPALQNLDPNYICGTLSGTGDSIRIENLENYQSYQVVFLAIDLYGNASATYLPTTVMPKPVTDFWEDMHDNGSQVDSGFCLISDTYGDGGPITSAMRAFRDDTLGATGFGRAFTRFYYAHVAWLGAYARAHWPLRVLFAVVLFPLIVVALAWHVLTLPGLFAIVAELIWMRRRRRQRRATRGAKLALAGVASLIALALGGAAAHAQDAAAYWNQSDNDDTTTDDTGPVEAKWIAGIKLGPYVPDIDAQFQAQTTNPQLKDYRPYHHMFGGYNIMPVIEGDRVIAHYFGQITVGGSIAYLGKSGHAYVDGTNATEPDRPESPGDPTTFHMIPLTIEASYRFTYFDDEFGVPIVPYVKGGFGYDFWWMTDPNGNFSYVGADNCHPVPATPATPCNQTKESSVGGSAGLVGSVGILIRAERIDADAAASMRSGGIQHAGFYAELEASWLDWFGQSNRLSLGDRTWFGGFAFEF